MRPNFFYHLHPPTIPADQSRWRYTLGAGGTAVFLLLVITLTGLLEAFYYIPTIAEAATSIQTLTYLVPFGGLVRNLHYWSAQFLLIISVVHLARIIFTGAYASPRRFNYLLGLALFVLAILLDFTGYVLRWDTGIQWAFVVGTNLVKSIPWVGETLYRALVGGTQLGQAALTRFYAWHIFGLTILAVILAIWHIFRVRRDGGIAVPSPDLHASRERITRFELARREVLAMIYTASGLILLSVISPAPIAPPIVEITAVTGDAQAPWFFLWVQQMLKWGAPFFWGVVIPFLILIVLSLIPYVLPKPATDELGRWFPKSNRLAQIIFALMILAIIILTFLSWVPVNACENLDVWLAIAFAILLIVLLLTWRVESRHPEPLGLTPTLTGDVEYCLTCHADLDEISPSHPVETFGCVICHGGERLALNANLAHSSIRGGSNPSDLTIAEASCGGDDCHSGSATDQRDHIQRVTTSIQATYAGAIANIRYTFGAQADLNPNYGSQTVTRFPNTNRDQSS